MNRHQRTALDWHGPLAIEALDPRFRWRLPDGLVVVLTVQSGYE